MPQGRPKLFEKARPASGRGRIARSSGTAKRRCRRRSCVAVSQSARPSIPWRRCATPNPQGPAIVSWSTCRKARLPGIARNLADTRPTRDRRGLDEGLHDAATVLCVRLSRQAGTRHISLAPRRRGCDALIEIPRMSASPVAEPITVAWPEAGRGARRALSRPWQSYPWRLKALKLKELS